MTINLVTDKSHHAPDYSATRPLARHLELDPSGAAFVNALDPLPEPMIFPVRPDPVKRKPLLARIRREHEAALSAGDVDGARLLYSQYERVRATTMQSDYCFENNDRIQLVLREAIAVLDERAKHQQPVMPPAPQAPFDADDIREYLETVLANGVIAGDRHVRHIASEAIGEIWAKTASTAVGNRPQPAFQHFCAALVAKVDRAARTATGPVAAPGSGSALEDDDED